MDYDAALKRLRGMSDPKVIDSMKRFGIRTDRALGVRVPDIRALAKEIGTDHQMAKRLCASGIHEAMLLASMVADIGKVTESQMSRWIGDFDSWDIADLTVSNLFWSWPDAREKALEWADDDREFVKRAGFAMMAKLAVSDKGMKDRDFEPFFKKIGEMADDERNFVKKAVNWALRQIGKRNKKLNGRACKVAEMLAEEDGKAARWVGKDALRELRSETVSARLS